MLEIEGKPIMTKKGLMLSVAAEKEAFNAWQREKANLEELVGTGNMRLFLNSVKNRTNVQ